MSNLELWRVGHDRGESCASNMSCGGRDGKGRCGLEQLHGVHDVSNGGALLLGNADAVGVQREWNAEKLRKKEVWLGSEMTTSTFETKLGE